MGVAGPSRNAASSNHASSIRCDSGPVHGRVRGMQVVACILVYWSYYSSQQFLVEDAHRRQGFRDRPIGLNELTPRCSCGKHLQPAS